MHHQHHYAFPSLWWLGTLGKLGLQRGPSKKCGWSRKPHSKTSETEATIFSIFAQLEHMPNRPNSSESGLVLGVFLPTLALLPPCIAASSCANLDNNFLTSTRTQGTKDLKARFCAALWQVGRFEGYRLQAVIHFSYGGHWQFYIHKDGIRNLEPCFLLVGYRVSSYNVISQVVLQLPSGRFNGYDKKKLRPRKAVGKGPSFGNNWICYPPWNWHSPWKWLVGILVSFWDGLFSGAMFVWGSVDLFSGI